jgi:LysM repeat protein
MSQNPKRVKVVANVFSSAEIATPVKELKLLNQQVNDEIIQGQSRIYPREFSSILNDLKNVH